MKNVFNFNFREIKSLIVQHLTSFQLEVTNSGTAICGDNKLADFSDDTLLSDTLSTTVVHINEEKINGNKTEVPVCSSPIQKSSPSPDEDESWRKISDVPTSTPRSQSKLSVEQQESLTKPSTDTESQIQIIPLQQSQAKNVCIKESLRNLFEEMKKKTKIGKQISVHNLFNSNELTGITNWSDLDFSDDEIRSIAGYALSDTETNLSK